MSIVNIPANQWGEFLEEFGRRHDGWLISLETHDHETGEIVASRSKPLQFIELDLEDDKNPRINVTVKEDNKTIKHILFRPSQVALYLSATGAEEALRIESLNTSTVLRFRSTIRPELVDDVA